LQEGQGSNLIRNTSKKVLAIKGSLLVMSKKRLLAEILGVTDGLTTFRRRLVWCFDAVAKYTQNMSVARRGPRIEPVKRPANLDKFAGQWVAVKDGQVIAHSPDPRSVVREMRGMGQLAEGAALQRAPRPSEALAVGLG
jgi:hypothetical protein